MLHTHMAALSFPELLTAFEDFCVHNPFFIDFEWLTPAEGREQLPNLIHAPGLVASFEVIGQSGTGSYIALWQEPAKVGGERPVVWLDSEGTPMGVFANSLADFLSLLPYNTSFICEILRECEREHIARQGMDFESLTAEIPTTLAWVRQRYPEQPHYIQWLKQVAGLNVEDQPVIHIAQAFKNHTNLRDWLGWK